MFLCIWAISAGRNEMSQFGLSERKWKRCLAWPFVYRRLVRSRLLTAKGDTERRSPRRTEPWRWTESLPNAKRSLSSYSLLDVQFLSDLSSRLPADALMCSLAGALLFGTLISKIIEIGATDQRQLRLETSVKSLNPNFCFSLKGLQFLLWRNTSDSLAKRPQSQEVLRPRNFSTHCTKIVGCFWGNAAAWIHPVSHFFCRSSPKPTVSW